MSPASWAARRGLHYGWLMVGVAFLIVLSAAGVRSVQAVMIRPLEEEFGWGRGEVSLALSLSILTFGLAAPLSGRLMDRFGIRRVALAFLALTVLGVVLSGLTARLWQLHLFWGVVAGLGTGGIALVMSATVASVWFESRRGLVTGILGGASSAGQLMFLPLLSLIIGAWGWRSAFAVLAALLVGLVLPASALLLRNRPRELGLTPYGAGTAGAPAVADNRVTSLREALRTGDYWLLISSFAICGFTTLGLIGVHFIPHAMEHGFSEAQATGILSIIGGMNVIGTIASGWLCDRYSPRKLLAGYYLFRALSLLALPLITTMPLMSLFAVVYGIDFIATVPPTVMLTADRFGRRSVGLLFGWITCAHMAGGALATALAGAIHDRAGDYTIAIYLSGMLGLVAAAMAFNLRPRTPAVAPEPA